MCFLSAAVVAVTSTLRLAMQRVSCGILVLILFWIPVTLVAQDDAPQDAENCKDSPIITRMPGSTIHSCENKEFEQVKMPAGKNAAGEVIEKTLGTREGVSEIQVFRNFETALKQAGMKIVYEDSPGTITANKGDTWYWLQNSGSYYYQTLLTVKSMQQEVTADASSIADELSKSGHIALYGIHSRLVKQRFCRIPRVFFQKLPNCCSRIL